MKRFFVLLLAVCTIGIAQAQVGIVRSAGFGAIKKAKPARKALTMPDAMIGITGGIGMTVSKPIVYPNGALAFDFALSITPKVAVGAFTQWGILENWSFGAMVVAGDYMSHQTAFVFGIGGAVNARASTLATGLGSGYDYQTGYVTNYKTGGVPVERVVLMSDGSTGGAAMRFGLITPKRFYMTFDLGIFPHLYRSVTDRYHPKDKAWYGTTIKNITACTMTLSFGYAFGIRPKSKTANLEAAL